VGGWAASQQEGQPVLPSTQSARSQQGWMEVSSGTGTWHGTWARKELHHCKGVKRYVQAMWCSVVSGVWVRTVCLRLLALLHVHTGGSDDAALLRARPPHTHIQPCRPLAMGTAACLRTRTRTNMHTRLPMQAQEARPTCLRRAVGCNNGPVEGVHVSATCECRWWIRARMRARATYTHARTPRERHLPTSPLPHGITGGRPPVAVGVSQGTMPLVATLFLCNARQQRRPGMRTKPWHAHGAGVEAPWGSGEAPPLHAAAHASVPGCPTRGGGQREPTHCCAACAAGQTRHPAGACGCCCPWPAGS